MEGIDKYYYIDILAVSLTLLQLYLLGDKNKYGFVSGIGANISWFITGLLSGSYGMLIGNCILCIVNIRGLIKWKE